MDGVHSKTWWEYLAVVSCLITEAEEGAEVVRFPSSHPHSKHEHTPNPLFDALLRNTEVHR